MVQQMVTFPYFHFSFSHTNLLIDSCLNSREDPLEKAMAAHSNILAWEIPWTEKPGGLQLQRVGHILVT